MKGINNASQFVADFGKAAVLGALGMVATGALVYAAIIASKVSIVALPIIALKTGYDTIRYKSLYNQTLWNGSRAKFGRVERQDYTRYDGIAVKRINTEKEKRHEALGEYYHGRKNLSWGAMDTVFTTSEDMEWLKREYSLRERKEKLENDYKLMRILAKSLVPYVGLIWAVATEIDREQANEQQCYLCKKSGSEVAHWNWRSALNYHQKALGIKLSRKPIQKPFCPITLMPFTRPWILLEDGFTYEKSAIEQWLISSPNRSPMIGVIPSATLLPNCAIHEMNSICPITQEPFQEPYYCVEDGHTYEKDAILKWFEVKIKESLEEDSCYSVQVKSPAAGFEIKTLTLYPNKVFFNKGIPQEQKPLVFNVNEFISEYLKDETQEVKCIFDSEIRGLIEQHIVETDHQKAEKLKRQIKERRKHLGLSVKKTFYNLDLSNLDLSNMNLKGLHQKDYLFKETDLSDSILKNCNFSNCRFINCNMQRALLINCEFRGTDVAFYNTDMKDAIIEEHCYLEKGSTWKLITDWEDFKTELSARGAINVDSVSLRSI